MSPKHRLSQPRGDGPDPALPGAQPTCFRMTVSCRPSGRRIYCIERLFISTCNGGTPPNLPFPFGFPSLCSGSASLPDPGVLFQCTPLIKPHQRLSILLPSLFFPPFCFPPVLYFTSRRDIPGMTTEATHFPGGDGLNPANQGRQSIPRSPCPISGITTVLLFWRNPAADIGTGSSLPVSHSPAHAKDLGAGLKLGHHPYPTRFQEKGLTLGSHRSRKRKQHC